MKFTYQGIEGLNGEYQTFGTVITIGERSPTGIPINTDKFFIKRPTPVLRQLGNRKGLVRENDPEFIQFNQSDRPELRQTIRFTIVHPVHLRDGWGSMADSFQFQLFAQQLPKHQSHPKAAPVCTGDGKSALRWKDGIYHEIECPNNLCEFRTGKPAPCKPKAKFAFQLKWPEHEAWALLPTPTTMLTTRSWYNINRQFLPFFKNLHKQAMALGFHDYTFYGLSGRMTLSKRTTNDGNQVPAIALSPEFKNQGNFRDFLIENNTMRGNFGTAPSVLETDPSDGELE